MLSLFFIDRVENYLGQPPVNKGADRVDGLYPGIIRELFDEAFEELKPKYSEFADKKAADVRASYFAKKNRRGGITETIDSTTRTERGRSSSVQPHHERQRAACCHSMSLWPSFSRIARCARAGTTRTFARFAP